MLKPPQLGNIHLKKPKHMNSWKAWAALFPANIGMNFYDVGKIATCYQTNRSEMYYVRTWILKSKWAGGAGRLLAGA